MKNQTKNSQAARSLTTTLGIAFWALSVAVLLISGGLQIFSNIQTQQATIANRQQLIAQGAAGKVSSFIQEKFSVLETTVRLANPVTASPEAQKQILESLLGTQPAFRQLVLLNTQYQELIKTSRISQTASGTFTERLGDVRLAQMQQRKEYISPVYIDPSTGEPLVIMAVPATDVLGDFQGTLVVEVNLKVDLWDLVDQLKVGETGHAYVVDRQGNLIAFGDTARVLKGENVGQLKTVSDFAHNPASALTIGVSTYTGIKGDTVVGTYVPLGTPDWAVVTELPWQEAYQEVLRNAVVSAGVTLVMATLAGLVGAYLARRLAVPLVNLTGTATRIASGEMDLQAAVAGPNEVASLATAFNSMTQQLRSLITSLEQRVVERTADLNRRSDYLAASAEVARAASSILESNRLVKESVELIRERFGLYYVGLFLVDERNEWAMLQAGTGQAGQAMLARGHKLPITGGSMIGWSISNAQARIALQAEADAVRRATAELPETRSEAALPLRSRGKVLGALTVQSAQPNAFDQDTVTVLQTMADQIAIALENARLLAESQVATEAMRRAAGESSREGWSQIMRTQSMPGVRSAAGGVDVVLNAQVQGDWPNEAQRALQEGRIVHAESARDQAPLAIPVKVRGNVIGVIDTFKPSAGSTWTPEEIALAETLADQLGTALESARLYQDTQRRAIREQLVGEITTRMRESLDMEAVLKTAVQEIGERLGLHDIAIQLEMQQDQANEAALARERG